MRIESLSSLRDELKGHFKRQELFPIIGSGFTYGCQTSKGGEVPSGTTMKQYMIAKLSEKNVCNLEQCNFSQVARYYERLIPESDMLEYFDNNFTGVRLSTLKCAFLNLNWKFIYTLNLDDAIENNSVFSTKINAGQKPRWDRLRSDKCVFKLHGDATEIIHYKNADSVLSLPSYLTSLSSNKELLDKLMTDLTYSNTILLGCSLSDELDLMTVAQALKVQNNTSRNRYYVTSHVPSAIEEIDLEDYGIDTVIVISDYNDFYEEFIALAEECSYMDDESTIEYKNLGCCDAASDRNVDYLIRGKYLHDKKKHVVYFPQFYIERALTSVLMKEINSHRIQIIHGNRVSGKSYLLAGLLKKFPNRDKYYFDSRNQIDTPLLQNLLEKKNCVLLFDTNVLTKRAMKVLLKSGDELLAKNNINIFCCVNNSDSEILGLITYSKKYELATPDNVKTYSLNYVLETTSSGELSQLNQRLIMHNLIPFSKGQSILDNLLNLQAKLRVQKQIRFDPHCTIGKEDSGKIALLILLAQNEKVSANELIKTRLTKESVSLLQEAESTVEEDHRNLLQLDAFEGASYQLVCNAKLWLLEQLRQISKNNYLRQAIIQAFEQLVISHLDASHNFRDIEQIVKFDKINEIFPDAKSLIIDIYDALRSILSDSYQYFHQYSKCLLWNIHSPSYSFEDLQKARIAATTAYSMANDALTDSPSALSHHVATAHILFTLTIIHSKMSMMENFKSEQTIEETLTYFAKAVGFKENYDAFLATKKQCGQKHDGSHVIYDWLRCVFQRKCAIPAKLSREWKIIVDFWMSL